MLNIKYKLADHMRNSMHIPDEYLPYLTVYKMSHWNVPSFKDALVDGTIKVANWQSECYVVYNVIYYNCTPAAAKCAKEIRLSFRKADSIFNIEPYVLVQIVEQ